MDQLIKNAVKIRKVGEEIDMDLGFDISMIQREENTLLQMEESKFDFSLWKADESEAEDICQELKEFLTDLDSKTPDPDTNVDRLIRRLSMLD